MTLPTLTTGSASAVGQIGITANGTIHPHGLYTRYYFEYGPDTTYGQRTPETDLPPRLAAHYHESFDQGIGGWKKRDGPIEHVGNGGASGGFVRYRSPTLDDHNHDDGIGTVHLPAYVFMGAYMNDELRKQIGADNPLIGAGEPDLRGAEVSFYVRGSEWQANGTELIWWTQSRGDPAVNRAPDWRCDPAANWAYTGQMFTDALYSGEWERVCCKLRHHSDQWSFGGYCTEQPDWKRYEYWPIDPVQAKVDYDFIFILAFVDPHNPPLGTIDFDEFHLTYRNRSLLFPSNGGRLIAAPKSDVDPARLTDGWRHGDEHTWHSAPNPTGPLEFVYAFDRPVSIETVQLHQNSDHPAREVECAVSTDGRTYTRLCTLTLPRTQIRHDNLCFAIRSDLSAPATHLRVSILSGYEDDYWGLGAIDVFGSGARMLTDDALYEVNTDIGGLVPGSTVHYRLVASNENGTTCGQDQTFDVPADACPHARTDGANRVTASTARIEGRLNAMGRRTTCYFEYGTTPSYGQRTPSTYAGLQPLPRLVFAAIDDLEPATRYHYRLIAANDAGETRGDDATFVTSTAI